MAIIAAYNEIDILPSVVHHLRDQKANVYLIDSCSTDGTFEFGQQLAEEEVLVGAERFPDRPSPTKDWIALLKRQAEVAVELQADWAVHSDADEIRAFPWPDRNLREGLAIASAIGCNAVDFSVVQHPYAQQRSYRVRAS